MPPERLFQVLQNIHPLPKGFREIVEAELEFVKYPKGYFLAQDNLVSHHAYFMERGFAVSYHETDTRKIATSFWPDGKIILSPQSFFTQTKSRETIQLTIDSELYCISHASVIKIFETFQVANFLTHLILAQYQTVSQELILDFHQLDAWERYLKLIKQFPGIEQNASQDIIASYIGVTPQSLSRLKHKRNQS